MGARIMKINLSDVLSEPHSPINTDVTLEMDEISVPFGTYQIITKEPVHVEVIHHKEKEIQINGRTAVVISIPCDRCLEPVQETLSLEFQKNINLDLSEEDSEELDEANYIDGYYLDVDQLLYNEILIGWPMKVLCCEDCKGICNICGHNLNEGACNCEDTSLDPRMSVVRDLFKNFKEV